MKIAVCGTQNTGKSTFVSDFCQKWPMYSKPEKSYREYIKSKNLNINEQGDESSQQIILDALIDQAFQYSREQNYIYDRCPLDNLAYTFWLNFYNPDKISNSFLEKTKTLVKESLKCFDIIFYVPISRWSPIPDISLENNENRSLDPFFREEIDAIFAGFYQSYAKSDGRVFPVNDCPAVIELIGNRDERINLASLYIDEDGKQYGENESLLIDAMENLPEEFRNKKFL